MSELLSLMVGLLGSIVSAHETNGIPLGYVVVLVIELPVVVLLLATLLGKPRKMKVTGLFLTWLGMVFTIFIGAVYVLSYVTGLFI